MGIGAPGLGSHEGGGPGGGGGGMGVVLVPTKVRRSIKTFRSNKKYY